MSECVITGCALVEGSCWSWGDLHRYGDVWIFHGSSPQREWESFTGGEEKWAETKALKIVVSQGLFQRRGVWVIQQSHALLNVAALTYIRAVDKMFP